jgi:hypothetical protein
MTSKLRGIVALTVALAPGIGHAIGFGEIALQSRIGEALRAEVPILAKGDEPQLTACFSIAPMRGADLPVITAAKTRLIRRGQGYVLQIFGSKPINEPIFAIAVQAGCGYDVIRDYVLIPEAPFMLAEAIPSSYAPPVTTGKPAKATEWHARAGETLVDIADAQAPRNLAERQRLIAALQRANPDLSPDIPLDDGTVVRIPKRTQGSAPPRNAASRPAAASTTDNSPPPRKPSPPRAKATTPPASKGVDQLRLGAAPEDVKPREKQSAEWQSQAATEERMLKLETTLHLLAQEVEKMDQALDLAAKAIEAQGKLASAQALPATQPAETPRISAPPLPTHAPQKTNWLELLISAALGAGISIGLARYFGRRPSSPDEELSPITHSAHPGNPPTAAEAVKPFKISEVVNTDVDEAPPPPPPPPVEPQLPIYDGPLDVALEPAIVDIATQDEYSVLDLAEIMLAFGRVRGAADTLAEYVDQNLPRSIQPWSMLLDLYRRGGMRQEFESLAEKMRSRFNASIPVWSDADTPISGLKALEDYPHIIQKTTTQWGTQACLDYLLGLISDTRAGQRNGFPLEVVEEIVLLMRILEDGYARKRPA